MTHSQNNPWFAVSMGLIGIIVGYGISTFQAASVTDNGYLREEVVQQPTVPPSGDDEPQGTPPEVGIGPVLGDDNATITVVEFTDFECPYCQRHYDQTYGQLKSQYIDTGKIRYEIRNYPLSFHPKAKPAAIAAMCADQQDKFWEMRDKLFDNSAEWKAAADVNTVFKKYAAELGLDAGDFDPCIDNQETSEIVDEDIAAAASAGVTGTPGFWVISDDGAAEQIVGAVPFSAFQQAIDGML